MKRTVKEPEERKKEFVNAAEELFLEKGYEKTSVSDIVKKVGVAHGLFYYYFDSKEEMIDQIVERMMADILEKLDQITDDEKLSAEEKMKRFMLHSLSEKKQRGYLMKYYSEKGSPALYFKLLDKIIDRLTPPLVKIVEQGVEEGSFETSYPEQTVRFWLHGRMFMAPSEEGWDPNRFIENVRSEGYILDRLLGTEDEFFLSFYEDMLEDVDEMLDVVKEGDGDE